MKVKLFFLAIVMLAAFPLFAGENSFIRIDDPENGDVRHEYNCDDLKNTKYTFVGAVSQDCVSVRVLWTSGDSNLLLEYLLNGSKPVKDMPLDDFTLKQFKSGQTRFEYNVSESLDNLAFGTNSYLFIAKFKDGRYKIARLTIYVYQEII